MDARIKRIIVDRALEKHEKLAAILRYLFVELAGVSQTKYYILGSYAIREHRTISDLDINMDHDEFFKLGALTDRGMGAVQIYGGAQIRWFFDLTHEYNALAGAADAMCAPSTPAASSRHGWRERWRGEAGSTRRTVRKRARARDCTRIGSCLS